MAELVDCTKEAYVGAQRERNEYMLTDQLLEVRSACRYSWTRTNFPDSLISPDKLVKGSPSSA